MEQQAQPSQHQMDPHRQQLQRFQARAPEGVEYPLYVNGMPIDSPPDWTHSAVTSGGAQCKWRAVSRRSQTPPWRTSAASRPSAGRNLGLSRATAGLEARLG
jgi:hypothetical protein